MNLTSRRRELVYSALNTTPSHVQKAPDPNRLLAVGLSMGLAILLLIGQLFRYQVVQHADLRQASDRQVSREVAVSAPRGVIVDANGRTLATDILVWDVSADPPLLTDAAKDRLAPRLGWLLDMPVEEVEAALSSTSAWVQLANGVPAATGKAILGFGEEGINCDPRALRTYPDGALVAHVLGLVNATGSGYYGVEGYYDAVLKSIAGSVLVEQDPLGEEIPGSSRSLVEGRAGTSLVLTLDANIQRKADQVLQQALKTTGAESGVILVMDPHSGAILASVSLPSYDSNEYAIADPGLLPDSVVSSMWEPGAVFDTITWAAAVDLGTITPETLFDDTTCIQVGGRSLCNWDMKSHGRVTAREALAQSLNVVAAQISTAMGSDAFYTYLRRFGFGEMSGVDLAGESQGLLRSPGDANWFPSDLGTNAFGQGIAMTPLQLATAISAVANGGFLMKPYIVQRLMLEGEAQVWESEVEPTFVRRVLSEESAEAMTYMLVDAAERSGPKVPGYQVAGKSGTAQIPTAYGYDPVGTIVSYVGFAPADDPRFVILVKLDRPETPLSGSEIAGPVFKAVADWLLQYWGIPPRSPK